MSNYLSVAVHPQTGEYEEVAMLDDYYGHYDYATLFKDGSIFPSEEVKHAKDSDWKFFDMKTAWKNQPHNSYNNPEKK